MSSEELDLVWNNIKAEARALADCEPMLASFYHATLLKHENLGSALSYMLANKLASSIMPAIAIREVVEEAYAAEPQMIASAACDIQAVRTRDPAVDKYSTPLLYLKGFHALQSYRIGHWLWKEGRRALAIFLQNQVSVSFQVDIHPAAKIGAGSVVLQPVPPHTTAAGVPARIVGKPESDMPAIDMDQHFNGANNGFEYGDGI